MMLYLVFKHKHRKNKNQEIEGKIRMKVALLHRKLTLRLTCVVIYPYTKY